MIKAAEIQNKRLEMTERPNPQAGNGEVIIKVHAAGVNRPDLFQVAGAYPPPPGASDIPGLEVAGTIQKGNDEWAEGTPVCALVAGGGYAEYVNAPSEQLLPIPEGWRLEEAAGLPETIFTVWANMKPFMKQGKRLLIHGGSSGIGHIAIQMAKFFGAEVAITAGSAEKLAFCKNLGADICINYREQDFESHIQSQWGENCVDAVLDMIGGGYVPKHLRMLKQGGTQVSIATLGGQKADIDLSMVMKKRLVLTGSTLRPRSVEEKGQLRDEILEHLMPAFNEKKIIPKIDRIFPLEHVNKAHELMRESKHMGKIILKI